MPLVEMKSNLSHIATNFGSDTTTANVPNKSRFISSRTTDLENAIPPIPVSTTEGVNYFLDIDATGFTVKRKYPDTDFKLNQYGQPKREQQMYLDMKGDFNPLYTMFHTAEPVFRVGSPNPGSPMENIPTVNSDGTPINSLYNRASTPNRMGFSYIPEFEDTNRYPTVRPTTTEQSRIYFKHTTDKLGIDNAGFTRPGLGLSTYYDQLNNDTGILGIRNDRVNQTLGFEQPYIVREIGERWGIDRIPEPSGLGTLVNIALDAFGNIGGAVLGRDPLVFIDRYFADVERLTSHANPIVSRFTITQENLFKQRRQFLTKIQPNEEWEKVTTTRYGIIGDLSTISSFGDLSKVATDFLQPGVYNPLHIYSIPGTLGIPNISLLESDFQEQIIDAGQNVLTGIAEYIAEEAGEIWDEVQADLVDFGTEFTKGKLVSSAKKFLKKKATKSFMKGVSGKFPVSQLIGAYNAGQGVVKQAKELEKKYNAFGALAGIVQERIGQSISKTTANKLNIDLSGVGVDKVNLIPYGTDKYTQDGDEQPVEALDFIPFKFYDAINEAHIVFRAILSGITDTFTPEYAEERYIGRPDKVYVYQGTNREIQFTFDVYPKSVRELASLWKKLNYLAGLTYPSWTNATGGGLGMISPFSRLTIGDMYYEAPGFISALTYTVQDNGTWETDVAKLPKYVQVSCTFVYIGHRLPATIQKHFDLDNVKETFYRGEQANILGQAAALAGGAFGLLGGNEVVDLANTAYRGFALGVIPKFGSGGFDDPNRQALNDPGRALTNTENNIGPGSLSGWQTEASSNPTSILNYGTTNINNWQPSTGLY